MKKIVFYIFSFATLMIICFVSPSEANRAYKGELKESLSILGLSLGESTLDDVEKVFGPSELTETGDAALYEAKRCYVIGKGKDAVMISFIVGEMGGGTLTAIRLDSAIKKIPAELDNCARVSVSTTKIKFINGLKLGLAKEQVKKILGQPKKDEMYSFEYYYEHKKIISKGHGLYDQFAKWCAGDLPFSTERWWIYADFRSSSLSNLSVSRISTLCE